MKKRAGADIGLVDGELLVTRTRQIDTLKRAIESLKRALKTLESGDPGEITAYELRETASCLEEMMGRKIDDDVLERIFESFCIGK